MQFLGSFHTSSTGTLKYQINVQQILSKFWILAHLHVYFVLHNIKEKMCRYNFLLVSYLLTRLFGLHIFPVL